MPTDSGWVFRLQLWGVPKETIGDEGQEHRAQLLQRIGDFLRAYEETRSGAGLDPMRLGFDLAPGEEGFELAFHEGRVERLLLPFLERETWWQ